jgi:hypothetical protein
MTNMEFKLEESQLKQLKEWQNKIYDLYGEYGHYDFIFTPYSMGTSLKVVSHITKTELDLTDFGEW